MFETPSMASALIENSGSTNRSCGDCSACCDGWLHTRVLEQKIGPGNPCKHSLGQGCAIHKSRPEDPCRVFFCAWVKLANALPDWMQPNLSRVIVLSGRSSWRGVAVDILVSAGRDPDSETLKWYEGFAQRNKRPFIYQLAENWYGFGPLDFQQDVAEKSRLGQPLWR